MENEIYKLYDINLFKVLKGFCFMGNWVDDHFEEFNAEEIENAGKPIPENYVFVNFGYSISGGGGSGEDFVLSAIKHSDSDNHFSLQAIYHPEEAIGDPDYYRYDSEITGYKPTFSKNIFYRNRGKGDFIVGADKVERDLSKKDLVRLIKKFKKE